MVKTKTNKMQAYRYFSVHRTSLAILELMSLHQDHNEPFKTFSTRLHSKEETCIFTTVSQRGCGKTNAKSNKEEAEVSVKQAKLSNVIESKEMGSHAVENSRTLSAVTTF